MMKKLFFVVVQMILVQNCASGPDIQYDNNLDCDLDSMKSDMPEYVKNITYLPLESTGDEIFRNIDKMLFRNGLIYIADYRSAKVIAYGMDGKTSFVIDRKGRGPGEYLDIKSFTVDDRFLYILDNFNRRISLYDCMDGTFVRSSAIDFIAWDMESFGNGEFIFAFTMSKSGSLNNKQPDGRIFLTDCNFTVKKSFFEYAKGDYDIIGQQRYFSVYGDRIVYSSFYFDGFVIFDRNNPHVRQCTGIVFSDPVPESLRKDESILERNYNYIPDVPVLCGKYIMMTVVDRAGYLVNCLYDMKNGVFSKNPDSGGRNYIYFPISSYDGQFVSLIDSEMTYDDLVLSGFERATKDVEQHIASGNPVLLFYEMN